MRHYAQLDRTNFAQSKIELERNRVYLEFLAEPPKFDIKVYWLEVNQLLRTYTDVVLEQVNGQVVKTQYQRVPLLVIQVL